MNEIIPVQLAVEDELSEVVLRAILRRSDRGYDVRRCFRPGGFGYLKKTINGFNNAAKGIPFIVLTDLNAAECAPALMKNWLRAPRHDNLMFRVAVKEVESWLIADRSALARFLGIKQEIVPETPDELKDAKQTLIELARRCPNAKLRNAIVPRRGSTAKIGSDYNATLGRFVESRWDIKAAMEASPSLRRTFEAISRFTPKLEKNGAISGGE